MSFSGYLPPAPILRAALYARLSKADREAGDSLEAQLAECRQLAEQEGYKIVSEYTDDGVSGNTLIEARPGLSAALAAAKRGEFERLVVRGRARFSRQTPRLAMHQETEFVLVGVLPHYVRDGLVKPDDLGGEITGYVSQHGKHDYLKTVRKNTMAGRYRRAAQGKVMVGATLPYGYTRERVNAGTNEAFTRLVPAPAERVIVRRIFREFIKGSSYSEIADRLNAEKVGRKLAGKWRGRHILTILTRTDYMGVRHYGLLKSEKLMTDQTKRWKVRPDDPSVVAYETPALVDRDVWQQAQSRVKSVVRRYSRRQPAGEYLLRGRVSCVKCGYGYYCKTYQKKNGRKLYRYRHSEYADDCPNHAIMLHRDPLEERVKHQLSTLLAIPEKEWDKLAQEATDKWLAETGQTRRQITDIDATLARLDRQLTTIRQQVTDGIFNAQDYAAERDRLQGDMAVLEKERGTLTSPAPKSWDIEDYRRDVLEGLYYQADSMETWTDQQWYESVDRNDVRIEVLEPNGGELGAKLRLRSVLKDLDLTNGVKVELPDKVVLTHRNPPSFGSAA